MAIIRAKGLTRINPPPVTGWRKMFHHPEETVAPVYDLTFSVDSDYTVVYGSDKDELTTMFRLLRGTLSPSVGTVTVFGQAPDSKQKRRIPFIGEVSERLAKELADDKPEDCFARCKAEGALPATEYLSRISSLSLLFGIETCLGQSFYRLTRNEQVRCMLIMALLRDSKFLMLDSPTEHSDPSERTELREFLKIHHAQQGTGIFLTSTRLEDTENAERVIVMDGGRIVFNDSGALFRKAVGNKKIVTLTLSEPPQLYGMPNARLIAQPSPLQMVLEVDLSRQSLRAFLEKLSKRLSITDIQAEELSFRQVVKKLNELR